jgi:hypothetical protein
VLTIVNKKSGGGGSRGGGDGVTPIQSLLLVLTLVNHKIHTLNICLGVCFENINTTIGGGVLRTVVSSVGETWRSKFFTNASV